MKLSRSVYRRMVHLCAAFAIIVALLLILGVIPAVRTEVTTGGTPQRALQAFWANVVLNLLSAGILVVIARRSKGRSRITTSVHIVVGLLVMLLGFALADAGSAYQSHGPNMQAASVILLICAAADILAGATAFALAFLQPAHGGAGAVESGGASPVSGHAV